MNKLQTFLLVLATLSALFISVLFLYVIFVVAPAIDGKNEHLAIMSACTQERLYLTQEITQSFSPLRGQSSEKEVAVINETLSNVTKYLHSQEFYQSCYEKTRLEWFGQ